MYITVRPFTPDPYRNPLSRSFLHSYDWVPRISLASMHHLGARVQLVDDLPLTLSERLDIIVRKDWARLEPYLQELEREDAEFVAASGG